MKNYDLLFYKFVKEQRPDYICLGTYINNSTKILMQHKICGHIWGITPAHFKNNRGCPKCANNKSINTTEFNTWINTNRPDYTLLSEYINNHTKVCIRHNKCNHEWFIIPNAFKTGNGCPKCAMSKSYSRIAIKWLNELAYLLSINIQHAENGHEFNIPNTRYKADGYCKEYNLILEFHGDKFHGGLVGSNILHNPLTKETGESCFENTVKRMNKLEELGYSVFYVFENDYNNGYIGDFFNKHPWALT